MSRPALMALLGVLALVALAYFALVAWRAEALAAVLLRGGYEARGWTQERLATRLRILGVIGVVVAVAAVAVAVSKMVG